MSKQYNHPPIHEAVFELRFPKGFELTDKKLESFKNSLKNLFSDYKIIERTEVNIHNDKDKQKIERTVAKINHFLSNDSIFQIQLEADRLSIHHLSVYKGWSNFEPIIKTILAKHETSFGTQAVSRLGLRYINHIKSSVDSGIQEIFSKPILPPEEIGGSLNDVYGNILVEKGNDCLRIQTKSILNPDSEFRLTILDLDYYREINIEKLDTLTWLNCAHEAVESAFEAYLTEETKKTFNT